MKFLIIGIFSLSAGISCCAQDQMNDALIQADSLFENKRFTQSFKIYQHLLEKERVMSPAMLLKMAFIKEGLGDYTNALYYLNLYHLQTTDKETLKKIEALAKKNNLEGYEFNDLDLAKSIFFKYFNVILIFLAVLAVMLIVLMFYRKNKSGHAPIAIGIVVVFVLALLFYTINFSKVYNKGIIAETNTYIMDGPSAGAEVITIVGKGHRIVVEGQKDVWTKTEWKGENAYVKTNKIKPVSFLQLL